MPSTPSSGITVETTLHHEEAFVASMAYMSAARPVLCETLVLAGQRRGEVIRRISEDNGRTWTETGTVVLQEHRGDRNLHWHHPTYCLDPEHGLLIEFTTQYERWANERMSFGPDATDDMLELRTGRIFYRFSRDEGRTWGARKQLVQTGPGYDETRWANGIEYGKNTGNLCPLSRVLKLRDGSILAPIWFWELGEDGELLKLPDRFGELIWPSTAVATFRGEWREELCDYEWQMSNAVTAPEYMTRGLDEGAVAELDDARLLMLMRGSSDVRQVMTGAKFFCTSKDGGRTWGPAVPLTYPDLRIVHSPSSLPNLFRSCKNGRVYLIANVLPAPTRGCDPRYPLVIAEVHPMYYWVIPETVTVIADRRDDQPDLVRFSNWQMIEDRETGNPVLFMTATRADAILPGSEGTILPHAYRYEIRLPE
ncbi:MAG: sialidase family protein [Acidobacteriota bacterium]|jgi:hypothetical protein|nr:sialidase family protein [Acidobacteriota bacterium]